MLTLSYVSSVGVHRVARCPGFWPDSPVFGDLSGQKYDAEPDN